MKTFIFFMIPVYAVMMTGKVLLALVIIAVTALLAFLMLVIWSHMKQPATGLVEGKLRACPEKPNCVCSENYPNKQDVHDIPPIVVNGKDIGLPWRLLKDAVVKSGGTVVSETDSYLHAEFTSKFFHFIDDVEMRMDRSAGEIHIRSASRIGHSDLGANRQRIKQIWSRLEAGQ
jgi:uncharacterized protein (DUF1499 family)